MLLVSEETIHALRERLRASRDVDGCGAELEKMLEIIEGLLWRAEEGRSCVGSWLPSCLNCEAQMIEQALDALKKGNLAETVSILEDYESFMQWRNRSGDG